MSRTGQLIPSSTPDLLQVEVHSFGGHRRQLQAEAHAAPPAQRGLLGRRHRIHAGAEVVLHRPSNREGSRVPAPVGKTILTQLFRAERSSHSPRKRSSCNAHYAWNAANRSKASFDINGIGGVACARHGCFVPGGMVDFPKGEW